MNLYRRRTVRANLVRPGLILALALVAGFTAFAQRRKPHKLRATAVLELTTEASGVVTARVLPVTILDEGIFHDASVYKATPKPMAIAPGVVYEAQKAGKPAGYVTIVSAGKTGSWSALGKWQAADTKPKAAPSTAPTPAPGSDRPIIHRGDSQPAATPGTSPSPSPTPAASPAATSTPEAAEPASPEDPNRPVLRHQKPPAPAQPAASASGTPAPATSATGSTKSTSGAPPDSKATASAQTLVAVSDTDSSDSRSYEFLWKQGEQAPMEAKLRRLALAQFPRETPALTERSLTNVSIRSFDLDLSNDAVMVLSAETPPATRPGGGKTGARYITLIARIDLEGNPQRLLSSVTDSTRLDVTPRLELIDAVDVKGDGYAELLFREHGYGEQSFLIYGAGRSTITKVFEGASSPLR